MINKSLYFRLSGLLCSEPEVCSRIWPNNKLTDLQIRSRKLAVLVPQLIMKVCDIQTSYKFVVWCCFIVVLKRVSFTDLSP